MHVILNKRLSIRMCVKTERGRKGERERRERERRKREIEGKRHMENEESRYHGQVWRGKERKEAARLQRITADMERLI